MQTVFQAKIAKHDGPSSTQKEDPSWGYGRKFIASLLDLCAADQNAVVQEKKFSSTDEVPKKKADRYEHPNEG